MLIQTQSNLGLNIGNTPKTYIQNLNFSSELLKAFKAILKSSEWFFEYKKNK